MKNRFLRLYAYLLPIFLMTGCTALKTEASKVGQSLKNGAAKVDGWVLAHQPQINATLGDIASIVSADAFKIVMTQAVSYADGTQKGDYLQGLEGALYANETTLVSDKDVLKLVQDWTPASTGGPQHWEVLAATLADTYAKAAPATPAARKAVIEQIAKGLDEATAANSGV